jgi:hypothetical protein
VYQTKKMPDVQISFFSCLYIANVCGLKRVGSRIASGGAGANIMQMGQSSYSIVLEWTKICTCGPQGHHLK